MTSEGLRQRKGAKTSVTNSTTEEEVVNDEGSNNNAATATTTTTTTSPAKQEKKKKKRYNDEIKTNPWYLLLFIPYFLFFSLVNPMTFGKLYSKYLLQKKPSCQGTCQFNTTTTTSVTTALSNVCQSVDSNRLIFIRIPKTATTSFLSLLEIQNKSLLLHNWDEMELIVTSLASKQSTSVARNTAGGGMTSRRGYYNPKTLYQDVQSYYQRALKTLVFPPYANQLRTVYQGHFYPLYNWTHQALQSYPSNYVTDKYPLFQFLPSFVQDLYSLQYPTTSSIDPIQITWLRHPYTRLWSMYHYDRHEARTTPWRQALVNGRGNLTLHDCLLDSYCTKINHLERWCNLQTEIISGCVSCGLNQLGATTTSNDNDNTGNELKTLNDDWTERAKKALETSFHAFGIVERMNESLEYMVHRLPTYIEKIPDSLPHEKRSKKIHTLERITSTWSTGAQERLQHICRFDLNLYQHAQNILTERMEKCF